MKENKIWLSKEVKKKINLLADDREVSVTTIIYWLLGMKLNMKNYRRFNEEVAGKVAVPWEVIDKFEKDGKDNEWSPNRQLEKILCITPYHKRGSYSSPQSPVSKGTKS